MAQPRNQATRQDASGDSAAGERRSPDAGSSPVVPSSSAARSSLEAGSQRHRANEPPAEDEGRRLEHLAKILSFAPWEEVWKKTSPQEVAIRLEALDLPESLRDAWRRWLVATGVKAETPED